MYVFLFWFMCLMCAGFFILLLLVFVVCLWFLRTRLSARHFLLFRALAQTLPCHVDPSPLEIQACFNVRFVCRHTSLYYIYLCCKRFFSRLPVVTCWQKEWCFVWGHWKSNEDTIHSLLLWRSSTSVELFGSSTGWGQRFKCEWDLRPRILRYGCSDTPRCK